MNWRYYSGLKIPLKEAEGVKERYSITSDIISFQICKRQYGFFAVKKYQPAHLTQMWYGLVIHQVLDKLHMHYKGLIDPATKNQIPTDNDVEKYFSQVENSLRARGVKAVSSSVSDTAKKVLKIFNRIEGPNLYPNVLDTECNLETDRGNYIMHGKVDVLKHISSGRMPNGYDAVEIWDYKGTKSPESQTKKGRMRLERFKLQMLVYAKLYQEKTGNYPLKCVLYFTNELDLNPEPHTRPTSATIEIDMRDPDNLDRLDRVVSNFDRTVREIKDCKNRDAWHPPDPTEIDKETCDICDLRWDCQSVRYPMRYP
ncbi:MAG: PD-(D/E)XK nuclease family protein [Candidatus Helarchaeota archaeon]